MFLFGRFSRWLVIGALAAGLSAAQGAETDPSRPTLGDLMLLTQFRQVKLWYAQKADNWPLAAYELDQLRSTIDRIAALYPEARSVSQRALIHETTDPAVAALSQAIAAKDGTAFENAYGRITDACNACHNAAGVGFIVVSAPTRSPFGNQMFEPADRK